MDMWRSDMKISVIPAAQKILITEAYSINLSEKSHIKNKNKDKENHVLYLYGPHIMLHLKTK